jgi:hypothetical protein
LIARQVSQYFSILALVSFCCCPWSLIGSEPAPLRTTVCAIAQGPKRFDNMLVVVSAEYESDGIEHDALVDRSCKGVGIVPVVSSGVVGGDALSAARHQGLPGTTDKTIIATFIGVFRWMPDRDPSQVLLVRKIENLTVKPKKAEAGAPGF